MTATDKITQLLAEYGLPAPTQPIGSGTCRFRLAGCADLYSSRYALSAADLVGPR